MTYFNYTPAVNNLTAGNLSGAINLVYTTPLQNYAYALAFFTILSLVYIKTQSAGLVAIIAILFMVVGGNLLGGIGDTMFFGIVLFSLLIVLFKFWKGNS